jgi:Tol biopolymer transport system component
MCFAALVTHAQTPSPSPTPATPPPSDIYIVDIKKNHDFKNRTDILKFGEPKKITDFVGYNNQPFFMPDGQTILYTSQRNKQTDIYAYDIRTGQTKADHQHARERILADADAGPKEHLGRAR